MSSLPDYINTAFIAATKAVDEIIKIYNKPFNPTLKNDGSPVTEADLNASKVISETLKHTNIPIIGEERIKADYSVRKNWSKVWIVDPLDGTKEFIKKNGEFAVNIALIENGKAVFGLIASPVKREFIFGGPAYGAFLANIDSVNDTNTWIKLTVKSLNSPITMIGSRSHDSGPVVPLINFIKEKYGSIKHIKMGSSMKFFELAKGNADIYPRYAPTMEWDIAAGHAIVNALGGKIVNATSGSELTYNKEDLYNPYFIASMKAYLEDNE